GSLYSGDSTPVSEVSSVEFTALQEKVSELSNAQAIDLTPLNAKISELEELIKSLSETGAEGGSVADAAMLSRLDQLEAGIEGLKTEMAGLQMKASDGGLAKADLDAALASVNTRIDAINAGEDKSSKFAGLVKELAGLSGSLSSLQAEVYRNSEQVSVLSSQSTELEKTVASVKAGELVARSVAVNAVATALNNDDPLSLPISSLEALVGEMPETQRLAALAQAGIPKAKELVSSLDAFSEALRDPATADEDASLSDRFWANAQSLVTFRSSGPREGDDPSAVLSRVKAALLKGDLNAAASEWAGLPSEVQATGAPWKKNLDIRIEAFSLYNKISSNLAAQAG
ncbi:MAG: hypothetical protein AAF412_07025, partial [Pseudomonadota bacterium]